MASQVPFAKQLFFMHVIGHRKLEKRPTMPGNDKHTTSIDSFLFADWTGTPSLQSPSGARGHPASSSAAP
eukprot:9200623-Pyramimonas_sp.AAC.1